MKALQKRVRSLEQQIADLQAYCGVLRPVFERLYKKDRWNWEGTKTRATRRKR